MVKPFNARDFEFRRLPGDVQGHRIVGIPGEEPPDAQGAIQQALGNSGNIRLAAYAPDGGAGAPIPGMGGAGSPRLQPQIPPLQGPPPASESEQITPVDIETNAPAFAKRLRRASSNGAVRAACRQVLPNRRAGAGCGGCTATGSCGGTSTHAAGAPAFAKWLRRASTSGNLRRLDAVARADPAGAAADHGASGRSAGAQLSGGRPLSARQQRAMQIMRNPMTDPASAGAAEQIFKVEEEFRKRAETQDESDYAAARTQHLQRVHEKEKFDREAADRAIKQQGERMGLEKTIAEIDKARYEAGLPRLQEAERTRSRSSRPSAPWLSRTSTSSAA